MIFNAARNHMETTQLFRIVSKMPKGGLLHCHLGAMVDLSWVFGTAIETDGMCISADVPLVSHEARQKASVKIEFSRHWTTGSSIWDDNYTAGTQCNLKVAAKTFPESGIDGFVAWMKDRCSITQSDSVRHHRGINDIWKKLVGGFTMITPIVFYEPITRKFLREFFKTALSDGIKWIEMRGMTRSFRLEGQDELVKDRTELVRVIHEEVEKFKRSDEGKGLWGVRMIWDCLRSFEDDAIIEGNFSC
jgi:adenosine deaminase CECR1